MGKLKFEFNANQLGLKKFSFISKNSINTLKVVD